MELNPKKIKKIGYTLLIGPVIGGVFTILTNFNVIVFGAIVAIFTLAIVFITFGYISPSISPSNKITQGDMQIPIPEFKALQKTRELLSEDSVSSVDFLTAGLASRKVMIIDILKNIRKPVRVAVQDPEKAITESEKLSSVKILNDIVTAIEHEQDAKKNLKFRFYSDHASLRLTLLRDRDKKPISAILGWYIYRKENTLLQGSLNPSILISQPDDLVKFAKEEFNNKWRKATPISFNEIKELYTEKFIEDRYYEDMYGKIKKDSYRQILNIMARKSNDWVSKREIRKKFKGKKTTLENGIKALRDRNIILSKPGSSGFYRLQLIGFAVWISKNNSKSEQEKQNNSA